MKKERLISFLVITVFVFYFAGIGVSQQDEGKKAAPALQDKKGSGQLDDVIIKAEDKIKVKSEKPELDISVDINSIAKNTLGTDSKFLNMNPRQVTAWRATYPVYLINSQVLAPWLSSIVKEPVAVFRPRARGIIVDRWALTIIDDRGHIFKKFSGFGMPPEKINWNGRNEAKTILEVGSFYSYLLTLVDIAGVRHTAIGEPFDIDSLLHQETRGLIISISPEKIFKDKEVVLREDSFLLIREVADIMKINFGFLTRVEAFGDEVGLDKARAEAVKKKLAEYLIIPEEKIRTIPLQRRRDIKPRVDIVIVNR